jgi:hypothetical protein
MKAALAASQPSSHSHTVRVQPGGSSARRAAPTVAWMVLRGSWTHVRNEGRLCVQW